MLKLRGNPLKALRGEGHDHFGSSREVASLEKAGTAVEELTGEVQGEMPMTWTRVVAVNVKRSSRALGFGRSSHSCHW